MHRGNGDGTDKGMGEMVSAWWLLVAFWVGGVLGLLLGAVAALTRTPREGGKGNPDEIGRASCRERVSVVG